MLLAGDDGTPRFICHACIGDAYLKAEIQRLQTHICMVCGKRGEAIAFDDLCNRVHKIVSEEFDVTSNEPESWEEDWERDGETNEILNEILNCKPLIEALKQELSDQHHSFDVAAAGEEDPYGDDVQYAPRGPYNSTFHDTWSAFETEIRTKARFFSRTAESALAILLRLYSHQAWNRRAGPSEEHRK